MRPGSEPSKKWHILTREEVYSWEDGKYRHGCTAAVVGFLKTNGCGFMPDDHRSELFEAIQKIFQLLKPDLLQSLDLKGNPLAASDLMTVAEAWASEPTRRKTRAAGRLLD